MEDYMPETAITPHRRFCLHCRDRDGADIRSSLNRIEVNTGARIRPAIVRAETRLNPATLRMIRLPLRLRARTATR